jgi:hypothetical protein
MSAVAQFFIRLAVTDGTVEQLQQVMGLAQVTRHQVDSPVPVIMAVLILHQWS